MVWEAWHNGYYWMALPRCCPVEHGVELQDLVGEEVQPSRLMWHSVLAESGQTRQSTVEERLSLFVACHISLTWDPDGSGPLQVALANVGRLLEETCASGSGRREMIGGPQQPYVALVLLAATRRLEY